MFSGIVQKLGRIEPTGESTRLTVSSPLFDGTHHLGDSVAVSGVCLTVVALGKRSASFDLSEETLRRTTLGERKAGEWVNLENSLRFGDAVHGHTVQGHVDSTAHLREVTQEASGIRLSFSLPREAAPFVAEKGSIAIDGISLTVGEVETGHGETGHGETGHGELEGGEGANFSVYIIPHTWENTTLQYLTVGARVNIETDCMARYVAKYVEHYIAAALKREQSKPFTSR